MIVTLYPFIIKHHIPSARPVRRPARWAGAFGRIMVHPHFCQRCKPVLSDVLWRRAVPTPRLGAVKQMRRYEQCDSMKTKHKKKCIFFFLFHLRIKVYAS